MKVAYSSRWVARSRIALLIAAFVAGCAGGPPPPEWQANATGAVDAGVAAYLKGDSRAATAEFDRARNEVASTGRPALLARVELMRCAAEVASLVFGLCEGFEKLRRDAAAPERVYAKHLAARKLPPVDIELLPPGQRAAAAAIAGGEATLASVQQIEDPLARLIAVAVLFQTGKASPEMIALASETASVQGWRRPLLAWLKVQALRAQRAGDAEELGRVQRRIELVQGGR
jgi:hypothetical protein